MKKLLFTVFALVSLGLSVSLSAQSMASVDNMTATNPGGEKIEILNNFKATKAQKKVIKKVKGYVTPRVLGRNVRTTALEGKAVKLQMALDANGLIDYIVVVEGIESKIDNKVIGLVKEYNEKNSFATSNIEKPAVVQMEIPVTRKKQYGE